MTHSHRRQPERKLSTTALAVVVPLTLASSVLAAPALAAQSPLVTWRTVVNSADLIPGSTKAFNSFNQPSVNTGGLVVFRARSKGPSPVRGVFTRNGFAASSPILPFLTAGGLVPEPNTTAATFNEFPSFPRISTVGSAIVTRGQSQPVYESQDGKIGTSGVYARVDESTVTGASLLGAVPGYEMYAVPEAVPGTRFDQFPGAPSIDGTAIAFKGNYTEGTGKTGVFVRDLSSPGNPVQLIANSDTRIPNQPTGEDVTFGSTAPPSAAAGKMVFVGLDNEQSPSLGGIYLAGTSGSPTLRTLVGIGDRVPGQSKAQTFSQLGESLSFDGRHVAFWGAWGSQFRQITLTCPTDGNANLLTFCNAQYPRGYTTSVPVHQGIFVYDTQTGRLQAAATTGDQYGDFLYWVFSGRVPGTGEGEEDTLEGPRWRSSAFMAVSGTAGSTYQVAFKASPVDGGSGIYLVRGPGSRPPFTVVDTSTSGTAIDPQAPPDSVVTSVGLERDGFRGRWLALSVSMASPTSAEAWAGIYITSVPKSLGG